MILALVGGALGAALGFTGLRALLAANPESIPRALEISLDWKVLAFTFGVSVKRRGAVSVRRPVRTAN